MTPRYILMMLLDHNDFVIHLEAAHIPRVAGILEAVLVALEEELQLESIETKNDQKLLIKKHKYDRCGP